MNNFAKFINSKKLTEFFGSSLFLGVCTIITLVCWYSKFVVLGFGILALVGCFILWTQSDLKGFFAIVALVQFVAFEDMDQVVNKTHVVGFIVIGVIAVISILFYIIKNFIVKKKKLTLGKLWIGFLCMGIGALLGGILCDSYDKFYTLYILAFSIGFALTYFLFINSTDGSARDFIARLFVWIGVLVSAQMLVYYAQCENLDQLYSWFNQKHLFLGWGMSNSTASVLAFCVPFALYFATKERPWIYIPLATIFSLAICATCSRGNILFSALVFPVALIVSAIVSKKKLSFAMSLLVTAVVVGVGYFALEDKILPLFSSVEELGFSDNGRFKIWEYAMNEFENNKIFGVGFFGEDGLELFGPLRKFHSTPIQLLASVGIVGLLGFLVHYVQRYQLMLTRFSVFKCFALFSFLVYELYGLIDINLLRIYETLMFLYILVACEKENEEIRTPLFCCKKLGCKNKLLNGANMKKISNEKDCSKTSNLGENNPVSMSVVNDSTHTQNSANESDLSAIIDNESKDSNDVSTNNDLNNNSENKLRQKHWLYRCFFKRFFDVFFSALFLIILSPIFLFLSVMGRIFVSKQFVFMQLRPGKNNKIFVFYKFKSMTDEKDANGVMLPDNLRLKKYGKFLRKTSLDELPQLWNILKGDMSFIGPRPKLVKDMIFYNNYQNRRSEVRPGITGYAQAHGRNLNSWADTFDKDVFYVENLSMWLDIKIVFTTAMKIVRKKEILTQDQVPDAYYFGNQLLKTNEISEDQYKEKIRLAHKLESKIIEEGNYDGKIFCSDECI